jgi:hypothetical protein
VSASVVRIEASATTFTAVCAECGVAFAGRLDLDLTRGTFLCREGHATEIVRVEPAAPSLGETEAA